MAMVELLGLGWRGLSWDLTSLNRPHCGGGLGAIPMQPADSLPQAKRREGTEGQWQKDREGAPRGDDRDEKTPHTTGGESRGP